MKPDKLIYTFVSYATLVDKSWGQGIAIEGIDRTAAIAHKHGIPVTWIVNAGSAPVLAERIGDWHARFGDDVILQVNFDADESETSSSRLKEALEQGWAAVQRHFPWAATKVVARGRIYNGFLEAAEKLGFQGVWGYCWEQTWWDGITHKGIPWGSWYVDSHRFKVPHPGKGKLVACEWTARDLHATYHSGSPCVYSTDPNDVLRAGLCTGDDIEYWKSLFHDYLANTDHNEQVHFLQQQESHEMEYTARFKVYPASHVDECSGMLDQFFAYITQYPITLTTLPRAVEAYHDRHAVTAPSYMLTRDTRIRPAVNEYTMTLGGTASGPWPDTFLYYDRDCQMAFIEGACAPDRLRSYVGKGDMSGEFEEAVPQVFVSGYERADGRIRMTFEIGHWAPMPFGLAYWDDLRGYRVTSCTTGVEAKQIQDRLIFLRFELTGAPARIELELAGRE
ncbi:hypothetical protein [Paenibacillus methanolicus]|uniref:Uncharacterized protein n=1 Tax=Paenibacillus methanolicus TaxID=582686 RepID=A0A5S5C434_9BACL|nr:hypothetical protein [Paenibacillus methanolicus]TYP73252.1 hypothetical protein BCM02_107236 [Paenibacillus methanolicus]